MTMEIQDVDGEERFMTIGSITRTLRLMVVVYTLRLKDDDETVRIISARKATPNERKFGSVQESVNTCAFAGFLSGRLVEHLSTESWPVALSAVFSSLL
jgi:hypothetical protein